MSVKIRLSRFGRTHAPMYRIVAVDGRSKRDGKSIENLGTYDPKRKELVQFHKDRVDYWLSVGAQASDTVKRLCKQYKKMHVDTAVVG